METQRNGEVDLCVAALVRVQTLRRAGFSLPPRPASAAPGS